MFLRCEGSRNDKVDWIAVTLKVTMTGALTLAAPKPGDAYDRVLLKTESSRSTGVSLGFSF